MLAKSVDIFRKKICICRTVVNIELTDIYTKSDTDIDFVATLPPNFFSDYAERRISRRSCFLKSTDPRFLSLILTLSVYL